MQSGRQGLPERRAFKARRGPQVLSVLQDRRVRRVPQEQPVLPAPPGRRDLRARPERPARLVLLVRPDRRGLSAATARRAPRGQPVPPARLGRPGRAIRARRQLLPMQRA